MFFVFLLTFLRARILIFLIMSRRIPNLCLYVGGNHVHYLNYGIFLLAGLGAFFLFGKPEGRSLQAGAVVYGLGMAPTFDEFGMWVRPGGGHWQRGQRGRRGVLAALFGLMACAPSVKQFGPRHWWSAVILAAVVVVFSILLVESFHYARRVVGLRLREIESGSPI